jgi:periplasmic divalent cation tolerance protein
LGPNISTIDSPHERICEIIITAPDPTWLAGLTRQLVDDRLVAGSHQIETVRSIYRWEGIVHDVRESRVALRTRCALFELIAQAVKDRHPYLTPSIVSVPIEKTTPDYHAWILTETRSDS